MGRLALQDVWEAAVCQALRESRFDEVCPSGTVASAPLRNPQSLSTWHTKRCTRKLERKRFMRSDGGSLSRVMIRFLVLLLVYGNPSRRDLAT